MAENGIELSTGFNFDSNGDYDGDLPIDWAPRRFWLDPGETKYVVFLDDDPVKLLEHEVTIGNFYYNRFICREMVNQECYFCNEVMTENYEGEKVDETPYNVWVLSIIDQTGYVDDDGNEHHNLKSILPMKRSSARKIKQKNEEHDGLRGHQFKVNRTTQQDYRIGEEWIEQGEFDLESEFDDSEPYDYQDLITVYDYDEQKEKYKGQNIVDDVMEESETDGNDEPSESDDFFEDGSDESSGNQSPESTQTEADVEPESSDDEGELVQYD